jgi:hypothetical protein
MTIARMHIVDARVAGTYHVVSRCVRRAWLCGCDPLTGVAAGSIVEDLDVVEDIGTRQLAGLVDALAEALLLQTTEKRKRSASPPSPQPHQPR